MKLEDLKKEVELLERKVELTRQYIELMEKCKRHDSKKQVEYVPYPVYPNYPNYPQWPVTYTYKTTAEPIITYNQ